MVYKPSPECGKHDMFIYYSATGDEIKIVYKNQPLVHVS